MIFEQWVAQVKLNGLALIIVQGSCKAPRGGNILKFKHIVNKYDQINVTVYDHLDDILHLFSKQYR